MLSTQALVLTGVFALASTLLWSTAGIILYGSAMMPNLFAELAGVSIEIAIAILIIERLSRAHQRRQSAFVYGILSDRAAVTFVDVMRLLWIRSSVSALRYNGERYDEFYQLAELHLAEYRSNIEGFAGSLEPAAHEAVRRIDRRLTWAISKLGARPEMATGCLEFEVLMRETGKALVIFLEGAYHEPYQREVVAVEQALRTASSDTTDGQDEPLERAFYMRLRAQDALVRDRGSEQPTPPGVWYDIDNDLAMPYFLIDHHLLTRFAAAG